VSGKVLGTRKKKETEWKREKRQYAMDLGQGVWVCFVLFFGIFDSFFGGFFFGGGLIFSSFVLQDDQRTADTGLHRPYPHVFSARRSIGPSLKYMQCEALTYG